MSLREAATRADKAGNALKTKREQPHTHQQPAEQTTPNPTTTTATPPTPQPAQQAQPTNNKKTANQLREEANKKYGVPPKPKAKTAKERQRKRRQNLTTLYVELNPEERAKLDAIAIAEQMPSTKALITKWITDYKL